MAFVPKGVPAKTEQSESKDTSTSSQLPPVVDLFAQNCSE